MKFIGCLLSAEKMAPLIAFVNEYNNKRPYQVLEMKCQGVVYEKSQKQYTELPDGDFY